MYIHLQIVTAERFPRRLGEVAACKNNQITLQ